MGTTTRAAKAEKSLKNGYITRVRCDNGERRYVAMPICSMDNYDICKGVGCPHRRGLSYPWWAYRRYPNLRFRRGYRSRPRETRRVQLPDYFGKRNFDNAEAARQKSIKSLNGYTFSTGR